MWENKVTNDVSMELLRITIRQDKISNIFFTQLSVRLYILIVGLINVPGFLDGFNTCKKL